MKKRTSLAAIAIAIGLAGTVTAKDASPPAAPASAAPSNAAPVGLEARGSYAIGLNLGMNLRRDGVTVEPDSVVQGLKDGLAGAPPRLIEAQIAAAMGELQSAVQARRKEASAHVAEANTAEGAAFLKANAAKPGVVTLPDGLQYQVLTAGTGPIPKATDTITCHYRGTLLNGKEFDSSYSRNEPMSIGVGGVIKGWTEALQRMPVGSKWRLFIPSELAYGEGGAGADIGPNAALIFEIELLSIQPKG